MVLAQTATSAPRVIGLALALALAGCASGESLDGAFGAQDMGVARGQAAGVSNTATPSLTVGSGANAVTYECPSVTVRSGASTWQVSDGAGGLRYQGNMGELARECAVVGQTMTVKVGIEGRVLLGEKGAPGTVKVPIRVAVVEEGPTPKTITTKFFTVAVEIPADQRQSSFTVVEDQISFPLLKPEDMSRYVVYVGYDPKGEAPQAKPARRQTTSRPAKPKPAAPAAAAPAAAPAPAPAAAAPSPSPASDPGAPSSDVFGPPPSAPTNTGGGFSTGGSRPTTSTGTFSPASQ